MRDVKYSPAPGLIVALICIPIFIGAVDLTVVSAVLPHVIYDLEIPLNTGLDEAAWIVSGYLLAYSIAMTFMGRLSDIHGRRKIFLISLAIFALGSYLVAVADTWPTHMVTRIHSWLLDGARLDTSQVSLYTVIASRMIQAFGAGAMVPVGMAVVADVYPLGKRAKMLGLIAAVDTSGWVIGHLYGGIVVRYFDWRMIFWLNLPICAVAFLLIAFILRDPDRDGSLPGMDWSGALLIALSLGLFNIGLGAGTEVSGALDSSGYTLPKYMFPTVLIALVVLALFIYREARASSPLIQLDLFQRVNFSAASVANFLLGVALFIAIASVPLFINTLVAQTVQQGAWDSGWLLSALTVPMAFAAIPGGWLTEHTNYRWPSILGLIMSIGGFLLMTTWKANTPYITMIPQLVLTGVGFGLTMAPIASAALDTAPQDQRGTASGLVILFRLVGMTLGVSGITTYGLYRTNTLSTQLIPSDISIPEAAQVLTTITENVISETFLIACGICLLALIPMFKIVSLKDRREAHE
jgi:MFS family permease